MLTRRKLFGMLAGVLAAPKELLAKPLLKFRQPGITAAASKPMYQFGFTQFKHLQYPATPDECFTCDLKIVAPRTMYKVVGFSGSGSDEC